jgi:flagellar hook-associated protein 3 FlgL
MRIASTQYQDTMLNALQNTNAALQGVTAQMASGQRVMLPSDDPVTTVRLSRMSREEATIKQYRDNIANLSTRLTQNEVGLSSMVQDMQQSRDLLVWARNGTNTSADVAAMAGTLVALRDSLFYTSNSKDQEGLSLYSGTLSNTATVTYNAAAAVGSRYTSTGNTATQQVVVGDGVTQAANVTLPEMSALLNWLDSTVQTLQTPGVNVNAPATQAVLTSALNGLDSTLSSVSGKIAALGGAQNILATLDSNHGNVSVSNQQAMITLGQLDYGEAATRLTGYTTALQATQKAYAKVSGLSLFNIL